LKTIIFAGGRYEDVDFYKRATEACDLRIAADSGAEFMKKIGVLPHILIGDMDSISFETFEECHKKGVKILKFPSRKDEIDTELAIIEAMRRSSESVFVAGAFGTRLDQMMAVFRLMERFEEMVLFNENLYSIVVKEVTVLKSFPGEIWSVIPLERDTHNVSLDGFEYSIFERTMEYLRPYGVSNKSIAETVEIDPGDGKLLVFRYHNGRVDWIDELAGILKNKKKR